MKDKIKYVEQQAKFRKAQTELRENGLENTPTTTKREIMRALEKEMDDHELMIFKRNQPE
ncbi:unnamed protein product [Paramecium octaurelia]|uniref:Uncharacterized protein n=1 Tax=Paramecium octaurelia TaxID=43137 RepID=A0A8S1WZW8_PAROT|nr:unnamed protein product [Paramecium octaurelia]